MSLDGSALALEPAPRSVQRARRWVADVCRSAGRADLVESAEAGTTELVTNAILHAPGPIDVRVSGTAEHLRIEVQDASRVPPRPQPAHRAPPAPDHPADPDDLDALLASLDDSLSTVSTVGRGLHIVATSALAWGAEITSDGKVVWFEPAPELRADLTEAELAGSVYATGEASAGAAVDAASSGAALVEVHLLGVPVDRLAAFRRHHLELRRELRLLALAHAADYPQAERLSALFADFETDFGPAVSGPEVTAALGSSAPYVDLALRLPADAPASVDTMLRLLDLADEFCRAARLLTLARSEADVGFAQWFLGQMGAQATGAPATPWGDAGPGARYSSP